jgi:ornithine decarboxylase
MSHAETVFPSPSFIFPTQLKDLNDYFTTSITSGGDLSMISSEMKGPCCHKSSTSMIEDELNQIHSDFNVEIVSPNYNVAEYIEKKINLLNLEDPFYIIDVGIIRQKLFLWRQCLPRVEPFYAMKCNPHPAILRMLKAFGVGFDCASKAEIQTIVETLQVSPEKVVFANPCKPPLHLQYAKDQGVALMTFDNLAELEKIRKHYPSAKLILRLLTDDSSSICRFGSKFGTPPNHVPILLKKTLDMGLELVGLSFHVGSGCLSVQAFEDAVRYAHNVYHQAKDMGIHMSILDIGGGFPGASDTYPYPSFQDIAAALAPVLDDLFPPDLGVRLIAEPGRYFAAESHALAVCVYARRDVDLELQEMGEKLSDNNRDNTDKERTEQEGPFIADETLPDDESMAKPDYLYYVNDGVYGSFNCIFFDHAKVTPLPLKPKDDNNLWRSTIFGPTCDSMDCITKNVMLPKLEVGEWIYFKEMGAYTVAAASKFNGFDHPNAFFVDSISHYNPG